MRIFHFPFLVVLTVLLPGITSAQSPAALSFDVASIKPSTFPSDAYKAGFQSYGGTCSNAPLKIEGNRATIRRARLCSVIRLAYQLQDFRIVYANGVKTAVKDDDMFDIQANVAGEPTPDRTRDMLKSLLADRFQLKFHMESRVIPVYAMTIAKGGLKLSTTDIRNCGAGDPLKPAEQSSRPRGVQWTSACRANQTTESIAYLLSHETDRPVIDRTGLTGKYAYSLSWTPEGVPMEANSPPVLSTAIQEQLGLKLEAVRVLFDVLVVDSAAQPGAN